MAQRSKIKRFNFPQPTNTENSGIVRNRDYNEAVLDIAELYSMMESNKRPYKVYTALLTQSGGDNPTFTVGDETIEKGVTYTINQLDSGDSLIPYGAPNNNLGTTFVCNQEAASWGSPFTQLSYNTGAPVVTVLENTIGNIWWTYIDVGNYFLNSNGLFLNNKTYTPNVLINTIPQMLTITTGNTSIIEFVTNDGNDCLFNTPIEIRVYL